MESIRYALIVWLSATQWLAPLRQVPGISEITDPGKGESVQGIVTIFGTASHPAFESFDLAFSFDPDLTDTWFSIGEPLDTPVADGRLAIWDTTEITDGVYRLRLRVHVVGSPPIETVIEDVRVRNYTATETPPPAAATTRPTLEATLLPTPLPVPAEPEVEPNRFTVSLRIGVIAGLFFMLATAIYVRLGPRVRAYTGYLRMRRMHQRQDRDRRRRE